MAKRIKSNIKRVRSSKKRKARNLEAKNNFKKAFKAAERAIAKKAGDALELVKKAISVAGKTAQRGIIHKNKAARKISRLMLKLNKLGQS
jgi:small subunit ribosomal protein S20